MHSHHWFPYHLSRRDAFKKFEKNLSSLQLAKLAEKLQAVDCKEWSSLVMLDCLKTLCSLLLDGQGIIDYQDECSKKQHTIM